MNDLPQWMIEDAARHLDWMTRYQPKVAAWLPNALAHLNSLIDGVSAILSGDVPLETAHRWLNDFVTWRNVYHHKLYNHFTEHVQAHAPEPAFSRSDADELMRQSLALVMDCQRVLARRRSAMGTHAIAALIDWQRNPTWLALMGAMEATDRAMIEALQLSETAYEVSEAQ